MIAANDCAADNAPAFLPSAETPAPNADRAADLGADLGAGVVNFG
jgi:hypothetical protein